MNYPKIIEIIDIIKENPRVKTLIFEFDKKILPGQFFMIWIPKIDEIPMSVSIIEDKIKGITFKNVGEATNALFNLKIGDKIGIRGPYGNGFKILGKKALIIGGGSGIATITPLIRQYCQRKLNTSVILGVKTKKDLFFEDRIINYGAKVYISSEDGSIGFKGLCTDFVSELVVKNNFDSIITCGPEVMMKKLFNLCKDIPFQASLERYIKCGFGLCGQCSLGEGLRVCVEGPVFSGEILKKIDDFGVFKKDAAGKKIMF